MLPAARGYRSGYYIGCFRRGSVYYRKVIHICAEDSPNVKYAAKQRELGLPITNEEIVPGVLSEEEYQYRRATWDKIRQCIGLDGKFYKGAELLLFPPAWLDAAELAATNRPSPNSLRWMGIDPAEGGDRSAWAIIDQFGLLELVSLKTPDTDVIPRETERLMVKHGIKDINVVFDRGGGGKQHADRMRANGHKDIRTVGFGEVISLDPKHGLQMVETRLDAKEDKSAFVNRRAEMYCEMSDLIGGTNGGSPFALPKEIINQQQEMTAASARDKDGLFQLKTYEGRQSLRNQLAPIPKTYDKDGKLKLLPKQNPTDPDDERTLVKLIGHSPDEADALALAIHGMLHKKVRMVASVG